MSEDDGEDLGAIAWPGFVDILSSVIIMFVFFVLIVASALYFHIIIFKSKILSETSQSTSAQSEAKELSKTNRSLMEKIKELEDNAKMLEEVTQHNDIQLYKEDSDFAESKEQTVDIDQDERSIIVYFGRDSISVTKDVEMQISEVTSSLLSEFSAERAKITILSGKNPNSLNDVLARRLAVARMLNVRNLFLPTDVPSERIVPKVSDKDDINGAYNWVKITFERISP